MIGPVGITAKSSNSGITGRGGTGVIRGRGVSRAVGSFLGRDIGAQGVSLAGFPASLGSGVAHPCVLWACPHPALTPMFCITTTKFRQPCVRKWEVGREEKQ